MSKGTPQRANASVCMHGVRTQGDDNQDRENSQHAPDEQQANDHVMRPKAGYKQQRTHLRTM
eukprot:6684-Eustigmatos_ZCMA.PRE.1